MKRACTIVTVCLAVAVLAACGERPQTSAGHKSDVAAYQGTGSNFVDAGWKPGDKTSWEQHLRARQQRGQNDYARIQ